MCFIRTFPCTDGPGPWINIYGSYAFPYIGVELGAKYIVVKRVFSFFHFWVYGDITYNDKCFRETFSKKETNDRETENNNSIRQMILMRSTITSYGNAIWRIQTLPMQSHIGLWAMDIYTYIYIYIYILNYLKACKPLLKIQVTQVILCLHIWQNLAQIYLQCLKKLVLIHFSYTLSRDYRVMRYRYSRLLFTSEDRICANLRVQEQSTNMTSQYQCPTFAWRHRSTVVTSQN